MARRCAVLIFLLLSLKLFALAHDVSAQTVISAGAPQPVIFDDFEHYSSPEPDPKVWTVVSGKWKVIDDGGNKVMACAGGGTALYIVAGREDWRDYMVELRLKIMGGADWGYGPLFRFQGEGNTYEFETWHSRNFFRFWRWVQGGYAALGGLDDVPPLSLDRWYSIKLTVRGDSFEALVDGYGTAKARDAAYAHGRVGLNSSGRAYFDDFKVTLLP